jgi:hypothetical protein
MYREVQQDGKRTYKRNTEARSPNHCGRGKAINITYSECVFVAFFIQHAKPMHHILLSPLACPFLPYFPTFSHHRYELKKKKLNTQNILIFCTTFVRNISHSKKN